MLIDPHKNATTHLSRLQIPVAETGIDAEGTAYRMDGVPIRTRKLYESAIPNDTTVLSQIYDRIREMKGP